MVCKVISHNLMGRVFSNFKIEVQNVNYGKMENALEIHFSSVNPSKPSNDTFHWLYIALFKMKKG